MESKRAEDSPDEGAVVRRRLTEGPLCDPFSLFDSANARAAGADQPRRPVVPIRRYRSTEWRGQGCVTARTHGCAVSRACARRARQPRRTRTRGRGHPRSDLEIAARGAPASRRNVGSPSILRSARQSNPIHLRKRSTDDAAEARGSRQHAARRDLFIDGARAPPRRRPRPLATIETRTPHRRTRQRPLDPARRAAGGHRRDRRARWDVREGGSEDPPLPSS